MLAPAKKRYSIYRHLARALWPNLSGGDLLVMVYGMTCYYDACSKEEVLDRPLVLVGIAATVDKWTQFEERWADALQERGIPYFDSAACSAWRREYEKWNKDEGIRGPFLERLAAIIAETASHFAYARMVPAHWHAMNSEYVLDGDEKSSSPYATLAMFAAELLHRTMRKSPFLTPGWQAVHVMEYGDTGQGRLRSLAARGEVPLSFQRKWDKETDLKIHAFAACDLVAHYVRRSIERHQTGKTKWKVFPSVLAKHFQTIAQPYEVPVDLDTLRLICERFPEYFPRREPRQA